jgi:molybdate transport system ATP-binding protein
MGLKAAFRKTFRGGPAITGELQVQLGAFGLTVLFGPSGCGKSTLLRCLAGLETPDSGSIVAGGEVWFDSASGARVPACERGIGLVFQDSVLFPHLDVAGNIGFGLRGWSAPERARRVAELTGLMGLEGLGQRRAAELSGGQRQRVALARALAPRPRLVLLDEPFASLDRAAAEVLRHNLRGILHALEVPAILVTHDPLEALALADRMLLMADGRILREGLPAAILADLGDGAGEPMGAVVRAVVAGRTEGLLRLVAGGAELFAPDPGGGFQEAYACIRGEGVSLERGAHGRMTQRNRLAATITAIEALGPLTRVQLDAGFPLQALITTWAAGDLQLQQGQEVQALIKASAIRVIPVEA